MGPWILRLAGFVVPKKFLAALGLGLAIALGASYSLYKASETSAKVIALEKALDVSKARIEALEGIAREQAEVLKRHGQVKEKLSAAQSKVRAAGSGPGPVDHARVQSAVQEARRALRSVSEPR